MTSTSAAPRVSVPPPVRLRERDTTPEPPVIVRIRSAKTAGSATALRWLRDPDERVLLAYVERFGANLTSKSDDERDILYQRAAASARRDGVAWTPLMDALEANSAWARSQTARDVWNMLGEMKWALPDDWTEPLEPYRRPDEWLAPLEAWISTAHPDDLLALLGAFRSEILWQLVARRAPAFNLVLSQALVTRPNLIPFVLRNPACTTEVREMIGWWVTAIACGQRVAPGAPEGGLDAGMNGIPPYELTPYVEGLAPTAEMQSVLVPLATRISRGAPKAGIGIFSATLAKNLLMDEKTVLSAESQAALVAAWTSVPVNIEKLVELIKHPSATSVVWEGATSQIESMAVRQALCEVPGARAARKVREALRFWLKPHHGAEDIQLTKGGARTLTPTQVEVLGILKALALEAPADEIGPLWHRILKLSPFIAVDVLDKGNSEALSGLTAGDLDALLEILMAREGQNRLNRHRSKVRDALHHVAGIALGGIPDAGATWLAGDGARWVKSLIETGSIEAVDLLESTPAALDGLVRRDFRPLLIHASSPEVRQRARGLIVRTPISREKAATTGSAEKTVRGGPTR